MRKNPAFIVLALALSLLIAGCLDSISGAKPTIAASPTPAFVPSNTPIPTAIIPESILEDNLDLSIAELEIVG
ncbi:MAG: hypothetical protein AABX01_03175 [Candidatus Micrarchaeota archaeon]